MFRTNPLATKLATQLAPAAIVTVVGIVLLSNLAKPSDPAPTSVAAETAINGEAVFTATPREPEVVAEEPRDKTVAPRPVVKPKAVAAGTPRKPANEPQQVANLPPPPPLSIVQIPEQQQPAADTTMMGKLRSATAAVTRIPQWAGQSLAGWFAAAPNPRPPASVPNQNFQASM